MAKNKKNGEANAKAPETDGATVRLMAPKGTATCGVPTDHGVVQVKVGKDGMVQVPTELTGKLLEAGFTHPPVKD